MRNSTEILACPKCHSRQYIFQIKNDKCVCKNHGSWFVSDKENFQIEGSKYDNYESANAI